MFFKMKFLDSPLMNKPDDAGGTGEETKTTEEKKKPENNTENSIDKKLDKLIELITPKQQETTVTKNIPVPQKPIKNESEKLEETKEVESTWRKFWKTIW